MPDDQLAAAPSPAAEPAAQEVRKPTGRARAPEAEAPAAEQDEGQVRRRRLWQRAKLWTKRAFALSAAVSTILVAGWVVWLLGEATLRRHVLDLETIKVPKQLEEAGFSGDVVTRRLRDEIKAVHGRAATTMPKADVEAHWDMSGITIPKAGVSVESAATAVRRLLPEGWWHEASGELVLLGQQLSMRLRLNGRVVFSEAVPGSDAVSTLIEKGAFRIVEETQPYVAASYLYEQKDDSV